MAKKITLKSEKELKNRRAKYFLKKGDILTRTNTEEIPDILQNKEIIMKVSNAVLSVTMLVKTLEEGFIGDTIKVMNPKYKKILLAQVRSKDELVLVN